MTCSRCCQTEVSDPGYILIDFAATKKEVPMMTDSPTRYALSFTSGALLMRGGARRSAHLPPRT